MAPGAGNKRKRGDWNNDGSRPSPHRPGNLNLAQQQQSQYYNQSRDGGDNRGRGGRRGSRGNRNSRRASDGPNFQQKESLKVASPFTPDEPRQAQWNGLPARGPTESPAPPPVIVKKTEPSSYAYDFVTDDHVKNWTSTGRQQVVDVGVGLCSKEDRIALASLFQELIQSAFDGRVPPSECGTVVKLITGERPASNEEVGIVSHPTFDSHSIFLDTLSILTDADPSRNNLRPLVLSTGIPLSLMRLQLDTPLLQALGLIRDTFSRMGIRKQTNILYRQSNYNLLREESEGYSKLLTELFTTSNNEPPSSEVVEETFERVKAMIGAFDMDVGRVLDVTLDVFAAVLIKQFRFCVKFLRASSWWPKEDTAAQGGAETGLPKWALPGSAGWSTSDEERKETLLLNQQRDRAFWDRVRQVGIKAFFEIGRRLSSDCDEHTSISYLDPELNDETKKWIEQTGTLPPKGNRVAAQLLGFKLRFYSSSSRNATDVLPDNLIYLAALLIKVGFISLRDLYPHLWRPDEAMEALKEEKMKEKTEREKAGRRGGGTMNALMMAGALADDTLPLPPRTRGLETRSATPAKEQEADKDKTAPPKAEEEQLPEPADQKVLLLKSLLAIGALPESLYILGRFPWLLDGYPELPEYIHRILHYCLHNIYSSVQPLSSRTELKERRKIVGSEQGAVSQGRVRLSDAAPRRVLRWALLDKEDIDGTDYRFYWDDWTDSLPVCQSVDDVFALCGSLLNLSGVKIGQDPSLLIKLARIGKHSLDEDTSESNRNRWIDMCKRLLVPALSLTKMNPGAVNEVFELLSCFPQNVRFSIYAEWYFGQTSRLPDIKSAFDQARFETKDALKRLSKTNIRPMARTLAKIAYANPGIVINVAVSQIESYENLIEVVVECARYFTYLGYDILTWSLINSLGHKGRSRMQESGLLTSRWLNSLASFAGRVFKRYSSIMNPVPVLQYVAEQLRHNNSTDLIVLEQLVSSMAGIVTDTNFNDAQVQAMAGGEVLQSQTMLQLLDKRHESKTTSKRLMKALTDSQLAGQLLIAIAQERVTCVFKETEADVELKLLGNIFDEIHRVLTQYLDLLRANFTEEEFDSFVPDVSSLIGEFGIQTEVAFWISRPSIAHRMLEYDKQQREATSKKAESEAATPSKSPDTDVEMGEAGDATEQAGKIDSVDSMAVDSTSQESQKADQESPTIPPTPAVNGITSTWHPVLDEMMETMKSKLPSDLWDVVGLPFYTTFWQLSLNDIYVPQKSYEDELERLKKRVIAISSDRSDLSMAGSQKKEREKKQVNDLHERILLEHKRHVKSFTQTRARLQKEREKWFAGMRGKHDALNLAIIQQCLLPRLLLSPVDALYCFKLFKYLHSSGTSNFRTLGLLDQLFRDQRLTSIIFQCTSKEADNLGRFLNEIFRDLSRWHADSAVYEKEAYGAKKDLPGFATAVDAEGKPTIFLSYEDFRRILYKWHRLFGAALKTCLTGGEYMHIRNAISVLKAVVQYFPALNWIGTDMLAIVNHLKTSDPRDDVKIPAASLIGDLNRREKKWLLPQAFMLNVPADRPAGAKSTTPQSRSATPRALSATAPEFKPSSVLPKSNGTGKSEVEEGEVEDAQRIAQAQKPATILSPPAPSEPTNLPESTVNDQKPNETDRQATEIKEQTSEHLTQLPPRPERSPNEFPKEMQPSSGPRNTVPESRAEWKSRTELAPSANIPKRPELEFRQPPPNLPNKPESHGSYRDGRMPGKPSDGLERRDVRREGRETRYQDHSRQPPHGRQEVIGDHPHPGDARVHGRPGHDRDRRDSTRIERDFGRRLPTEDHFSRPSPRDPAALPRDQEHHDRLNRGRLNQPDASHPRGDSYRQSRDDMNQSRLGDFQQFHDHKMEMNRDHVPPGRLQRDDRRPLSSRPPSPPRADDNRGRLDKGDDRDDRKNFPLQSSRRDEVPLGPRGDRPQPTIPENRPQADFPRDTRDLRQPHPPSDPNYGRLNQDSRYPRTQENFDRPTDIPSGPRRTLPGRGARAAPAPAPTPAPAPPQVTPTSRTDRHLPSGPSGWTGQRHGQQQDPAPSSSASVPSPLDTSGIHPDRLRALQVPDRPYGPSSQPPSPAPISAPSGPRGAPPSGPSPTRPSAPGTGFANERGRGDKRFAGLNNMLQQGSGPLDRGGQGTMIRGRGAVGRQSGSANAPSPQVTRPQTPAENQSGMAQGPGKPDLFPSRANGAPQHTSHRQELEEETRRVGRTGRRSEIMGEAASQARGSPRQSSSGTHTPDRPTDLGSDRIADRDRGRERNRRGDDEITRGSESKREEYRERPRERDRDRDRERERESRDKDRDRDRDRDRERGRGNEPADYRDETRNSQESSRRVSQHLDNSQAQTPGRSRRDKRERYDGPGSQSGGPFDTSGRITANKSTPHQPPPPPPPPPPASDDRRWSRGDDRNRDREIRDRERDRDRGDRDRDRDRDRSRREPGNGRGGGSGNRDSGTTGAPVNTWTRKRGRGVPGNGDDVQDQGASMRAASESKRSRR
ncbi:conserved hypothetical protein [Uncinocarpus reesii 1704]|uniref:THO complex subunit 2 n=1 Tax=Uncinocarpus reesii (strain UAMH 1704) TaxID=336963 RepID=C4JNA4_UNCRE|nr:uncharacterized protein UREG_04310 [Uncinocarpus reesii 1704]EEP79464.1 conserved hypothetical protein [Uncinocarpus reesii 1704]